MHRRFPGFPTAPRFRFAGALVAALAAIATPACAQTGAVQETARLYDVAFRVQLAAGRETATVVIAVEQLNRELRELRLTVDDNFFRGFTGDGDLAVEAGTVAWRLPASGGELRYEATIPRKRGGAWDAYVASDWALFRAFDIIPPIASRTVAGARSRSRLEFDLPDGATVTTAYPPSRDGGFVVESAGRRFSRPAGWILAGEYGKRIDRAGRVRVVVAGPKGNGVRRMDVLAFLRWNLPAVVELLPGYPSRLFVASAGDPLWRGGLSAPGSVYLHADRPLISENGTSTLLHEVMHTALRFAPGSDDWIVEAFAEFYAIELMRRSRTLSEERARLAFAGLQEWGTSAETLATDSASGAQTARGVTLLAAVDSEIREATHGTRNLDHLTRQLAASEARLDLPALRAAAAEIAGRPLAVLEKTL